MPYTPNSWLDGPAGGTPITAATLTHLETQYTNAVTAAASYTDNSMLGVPQFFAADKIVYVSGTSGNDSNTGRAPGTPLKTIQAAVALLSSGGRIIILPGNIQLSGPIAITQSNIIIEGSGQNATAIVVNGNYDAFQISGFQVAIKNLWIGSFVARTAGNGVTITGTSGAHLGYVLLENLTIQNTYSGVQAQYADSVIWSNVKYFQSISGAQGGASVFGIISSASHFMNNVLAVATTGTMVGVGFLLDSDTDTIAMSKCLASFAAKGIQLKNSIGGASSGPRLVRLTDCYFESSTAEGVLITDGRDVRLSGVHSAVNTTIGFSITGGTSIKLTSCMSLQNGTFGYFISGPNDARLDGCDASNNSQTTSGSSDGCFINNSTTHVRIYGCRFGDYVFAGATQRYGLTISLTSTDWIVAQANDFAGNVNASGLNNASTGTHNSITGNVT